VDLPFNRYLALATLVIFAFMTNVGLWSDHSNWLTHDLEHNVHLTAETASASYASMHESETQHASSASSALAVEHELLHAANHLQLFLGMSLRIIFLPMARLSVTCFDVLAILCATPEAPFRPPRLSPSLS
jgi:hypothetical protein